MSSIRKEETYVSTSAHHAHWRALFHQSADAVDSSSRSSAKGKRGTQQLKKKKKNSRTTHLPPRRKKRKHSWADALRSEPQYQIGVLSGGGPSSGNRNLSLGEFDHDDLNSGEQQQLALVSPTGKRQQRSERPRDVHTTHILKMHENGQEEDVVITTEHQQDAEGCFDAEGVLHLPTIRQIPRVYTAPMLQERLGSAAVWRREQRSGKQERGGEKRKGLPFRQSACSSSSSAVSLTQQWERQQREKEVALAVAGESSSRPTTVASSRSDAFRFGPMNSNLNSRAETLADLLANVDAMSAREAREAARRRR
jgi:hypothetical protein